MDLGRRWPLDEVSSASATASHITRIVTVLV